MGRELGLEMKTMRWLAVAGLTALLSSAGPLAYAAEPGGPERLPTEKEVFEIKFRQALVAAIDGASGNASDSERAALRAFYDGRDGKPFWVESGKLTPAASSVIAVMGKAGDYALRPADYAVPNLDASAPGSLAESDIKISLAVLAYAHDAHVGRVIPEQVSNNIDRGSTPPDPKKVLDGLAKAGDAGAGLLAYHPKHPQFELLRKKWLELKGGAAPAEPVETAESVETEETAVALLDVPKVRIPGGPVLHPGDVHPQIALLRKRLKSPLSPDANEDDLNSYDDVLFETVRKFQSENGLPDHGAIDRKLRAALNEQLKAAGTKAAAKKPAAKARPVSTAALMERLEVNMQRWRWIREDLGSFHIMNNVPEFMTRTYDKGQVVFSERIVAGKTDTPTPTFSQEMQYLEFNPYWNVPNSIKTGEILPNLRAGKDIMAAQNLRAFYKGQPVDVYNVDFSTTDIRSLDFQQPPGGGNVLGVVKFMFPNKHDVYMHDTPSKSLFTKDVRAYSHGCMRVRNPKEFAAFIMGHDQGWDMGDVERVIAEGANQQVRLQTPIPVHVTYFTAWVGDEGKVATFDDLYGHDRRLALALNGKSELLAREMAVEKAKAVRAAAIAPDPGFQDSAPNLLQLLFGGN